MYAGLGGQVDLQGRRNRGPSLNMADSSGCSEKSRICGHCREIGSKAWSKSFTLTVLSQWLTQLMTLSPLLTMSFIVSLMTLFTLNKLARLGCITGRPHGIH